MRWTPVGPPNPTGGSSCTVETRSRRGNDIVGHANHALQRHDLGFVFLEEIGSLGVFVKGAGFIFLNWRERSCRLASAYRVSPPMNSCAICRLNSMLWERCLAMAFVLRKPSSPCQINNLNLSGPRAHSTEGESSPDFDPPRFLGGVYSKGCLFGAGPMAAGR